jgi:hypothetical protein
VPVAFGGEDAGSLAPATAGASALRAPSSR